ncbi:twin-arginine translocation signal domain-containing protein [Nitratifractor salsuginis]|uniref:Tat (Twin-arginine translocation) pathway signal sequence domain protein n=1 Tax=Nitratifractor salsuginis (strain DSM 16511 / JCM 12458 / E9I37-1) TaxID=749222 RepID=E6X123_NITSE|nr:twin-arginine translocation signal domain-containing protein [Nitratifractor salsuginis]ADV45826.1 hypothetical protein Nitsa_0557 [Nitratifractor salsuginis DSM 16511]
MKRRDFMKNAALVAGAMGLAASSANASGMGAACVLGSTPTAPGKGEKAPKGPVTYYTEFKIWIPEREKMVHHMEKLVQKLKKERGFLSFSLKNMVGDSTMVHNYPTNLKGILETAYLDAAKEDSLPLFYSLFVRFASYEDLKRSGVMEDFRALMKSFGGLSENFSEGVYVTVSAGDREKIYLSRKEIEHFLRHQADVPISDLVTVNNHVAILAKDREVFNKKSTALLKVAQDTFRPAKGDFDYNPKFPKGMPGSYQNLHYRAAVTTEILQSAFAPDGKYRYLFHGTWETVYDHENSHIDPRFRHHVMAILPYIVEGPIEPFYKTTVLVNG